jgi:hypothetical protein
VRRRCKYICYYGVMQRHMQVQMPLPLMPLLPLPSMDEEPHHPMDARTCHCQLMLSHC